MLQLLVNVQPQDAFFVFLWWLLFSWINHCSHYKEMHPQVIMESIKKSTTGMGARETEVLGRTWGRRLGAFHWTRTDSPTTRPRSCSALAWWLTLHLASARRSHYRIMPRKRLQRYHDCSPHFNTGHAGWQPGRCATQMMFRMVTRTSFNTESLSPHISQFYITTEQARETDKKDEYQKWACYNGIWQAWLDLLPLNRRWVFQCFTFSILYLLR